ncbi:hypothetical protein [Embleya sp. MST-111070]|uniref:hypothetical protein n=1 Tax=Embleya sp. MST-111070 TaxID=3398231 RepID=UPI003F732CF8
MTTYAVSANTRRFWELPDPAELAYVPVDNAELHAEKIRGTPLAADPTAPRAGPFAEPESTFEHLRP